MKLLVHGGGSEIGGNCIEIRSEKARIVIDVGIPLASTEVPAEKILPAVHGFYNDYGQPLVDGLFLSHAHLDHFGFLECVHDNIPVYLSEGTRKLIGIHDYFHDTHFTGKKCYFIHPYKKFSIEDITITPYPVDHSAPDAFGFLIESKRVKIFYSGDFRRTGRKNYLFEDNLAKLPAKIDCLVLEGTLLPGTKDRGIATEKQGENHLVKILKEKPDVFKFVACSSQNIDRIVSLYRACKRTGNTLVISPYTAYILDSLSGLSRNIPQYHWDHIKVFFAPGFHTQKLADDHTLYKYKSAKISYDEIQKSRERMLILDSYNTRKYIKDKNNLQNPLLIYSMWEGYFESVKDFWGGVNATVINIHASGHATTKDLQLLVEHLNPETIVPVHTLHPELYTHYFPNHTILTDTNELYLDR